MARKYCYQSPTEGYAVSFLRLIIIVACALHLADVSAQNAGIPFSFLALQVYGLPAERHLHTITTTLTHGSAGVHG